MVTEVLRPQDCLLRTPRPLHRRRDSPSKPVSRVVSGRVAVLRRRESLETTRKARKGHGFDPRVFGAEQLDGPCPGMAPRKVRLRPASTAPLYAGSSCALSPSPRALPLPRFSRRTGEPSSAAAANQVDPSATRGLRRLLRLE
ncbi:hypothetical protein Cni_G21357 [Canna indica]|uniref:Uncharacterized protein n=1 Tax=Canna indica TaxID=4628 RepID=A0AAQ3KQP2_9LILI|nr:hypothetical protein Cni_G21357 [Canna indica]